MQLKLEILGSMYNNASNDLENVSINVHLIKHTVETEGECSQICNHYVTQIVYILNQNLEIRQTFCPPLPKCITPKIITTKNSRVTNFAIFFKGSSQRVVSACSSKNS